MTGHYPATESRSGPSGPVYTARCSCGWNFPAVSHEHSVTQFRDHHLQKTGVLPPAPTITPRRTR